VRRIRFFTAALAAAPLMFGGCVEEGPVSIGGPLIGLPVFTDEIILEAGDYLIQDTTLTGYTQPAAAPWALIAQAFEGELDAHSFVRFAPAPQTVAYRDDAGITRTDSLPTYLFGEVIVAVDTLRSVGLDETIVLQLYDIAEEWDPSTASWTFRVDSPDARLSWAQPGGTTGTLLDEVTLEPGVDTVVFVVDSTVIHRWQDTEDGTRGALIAAVTPGVRIRTTTPAVRAPVQMRLHAFPSARPDTVVTGTVATVALTFAYTPDPGPDAALRIGGLPAARAVFRFRHDLPSVVVGCPDRCVPLRSVTVNSAHLMLEPIAVPPAFMPEDSLRLRGRVVATSPFAPIERAPLGDTLIVQRAIAPDVFVNASPELVRVPITRFFRGIAQQPAEGAEPPSRDLALLEFPETALFGFGRFASNPRLRIVISYQQDAIVEGTP
jgi:hypothetical protein